jgi:radical SAM protein with 4Fe4S-binding SPASM domain
VIPYTRLHEVDRHVLRDVLPLAKPFTVLIEPSSRCNFSCLQCFQSLREESYFTRSRTHLSLDRFSRVLDQLVAWDGPRIKVLKLSLYGEPLLNGDFGEMLRLAREAGVAERIETTTNASLLTRELAEDLVQHGLDYLRVSVYATTEERQRAVTGTKVSLADIRENLRVLRQVRVAAGAERPFVGCKMIDAYGEDNQRFLDAFRDVADETYIDKPHGWIRTGEVDFIERYYETAAEDVREDLRAASVSRVACPLAFTTMAVRSNGDVSPCCVDYAGGTNLGNVDDQTLRALWESDEWYEFQKMQLEGRRAENPSCAGCDFPLSSHYTKDDIDGVDVSLLRRPDGGADDAC